MCVYVCVHMPAVVYLPTLLHVYEYVCAWICGFSSFIINGSAATNQPVASHSPSTAVTLEAMCSVAIAAHCMQRRTANSGKLKQKAHTHT